MPDRDRLPYRRLGVMMKQPVRFDPSHAAEALYCYRKKAPLVHCMTNDVVQSFTANVLLALGASPAMVVDAEEAAEFSHIADALLINVGTLTRSRSEAMLQAARVVSARGGCWTLDPVAVGPLSFRSHFCQQLLELKPAAIRGNASEILALAGEAAQGRGVDTQHTSDAAITAAQKLASGTGAVVAVSGAIDYVTDGERTLSVTGGSPLMARVVGTGCALSAVVASFVSLPGDRLIHVASACHLFAEAGGNAALASAGPGSFVSAFLDALYLQHQRAE